VVWWFICASPLLATEVGGIINSDTTWTLPNSPYDITSEIQIAEEATLTIEPGVIISSSISRKKISLWGSLIAIGTENHKIVFNDIHIECKSNATSTLVLQYTDFNGGSFDFSYPKSFILRDSVLQNLSDIANRIAIICPSADSYIERNIILDSIPFEIGYILLDVPAHKFYVRNNVFYNQQFSAIRLDGHHPQYYVVEYNSFLSTDKLALVLTDLVPGNVSAINNFWNTLDMNIINSMVYDRNDNLNINAYFTLAPILTAPHPNTPVLDLNQKPIADAGGDQIVFDAVTLDGSNSSDSDGSIVLWEWSLHHRTNALFNRTAFGQIVTVTNLSPGFYDVSLVVTDNMSKTATDSMLLAVGGNLACINNDARLGLAQVIYILQVIAGARP
jgi:hypothetical protein